MQANSSDAVVAYETAYKYSPQKELRLLCLHEIAWCMMIQLKFTEAMHRFNELSKCSIYSKAFYLYLTGICQGATGNYQNLSAFRDEIVQILTKSKQKVGLRVTCVGKLNFMVYHCIQDTQISTFVEHRVKIFPSGDDDNFSGQQKPPLYWKLLVYEVLFLWCALSNVAEEDLKVIIAGTIYLKIYPDSTISRQSYK